MNEHARILIVDDTEMNRDMLSRRMKRHGYLVETADGGAAALSLITDKSFDLVILDIMMPDVDGMTVLKTLRERFDPSDLPILMATAKDGAEDIVRALELGANDYVTKPLDFPVVVARVRTQLALKRSHEQLRAAHRRMKDDLDAAGRIQQSLIPAEAPKTDRAHFAWAFRPCTELGGDILDIVQVDEDHIGFYLVDVCGHGVPAALLSVTVSRLLSHTAADSLLRNGQNAASPAKIAEMLNRRFQMDGSRQYFTFIYGLLDTQNLKLSFTCAGAPGPLHVRPDGQVSYLSKEGFAIGWFPGCEYEEHVLDLSPGDRLYFFSDGVIEETNAEGEMFQVERLSQLCASTISLPIASTLDELLLELHTWNTGETFSDDVSVLAIEIAALR